MRLIMGALLLGLTACGSNESEPQPQADAPQSVATVSRPATPAAPVQTAMMAIPDNPEALKRLETMGYTVHDEEGHLHAPGVKGCPAMADSPVM